MTQSILTRLAREFIKANPVKSNEIIESSTPKRTDLEEISFYFKVYTKQEKEVTQPGRKYAEPKKVFVAAMLNVFGNQRMFNSTISDILEIQRCVATNIIKESECRYRIDEDFRIKVDNFLTKIK